MQDQIIARGGANGKGNGGISEALAKRILRGLDLWTSKGHLIEWVDEDRCKVPSARHDGRFYLVVFGEDGERCNCGDREGEKIGTCKHRICALISWAKRVSYEVRKGHDSRFGADVWRLVEIKAGNERVLYQSDHCGEVYMMKISLENPEWDLVSA